MKPESYATAIVTAIVMMLVVLYFASLEHERLRELAEQPVVVRHLNVPTLQSEAAPKE